ncbi:MAG: apolipoprotein D and lipocalin family protein [Janthinobacterium sp.]|jgi:apolipoprotein D and lipocalin family protein
MKKTLLFPSLLLACLLLIGCVGKPDNITPVARLDTASYLGTWYEIARLDHSFEKGLSQVSAEYSLRSDGGVKVVNRGYHAADGIWKEAVGKAYFVGPPDQGHLKVSFFGPFYGAYVVFELDRQRYSLVSGPNKSYFWLLSRTRTLDAATQQRLIARAAQLGFDTSKLIYSQQD